MMQFFSLAKDKWDEEYETSVTEAEEAITFAVTESDAVTNLIHRMLKERGEDVADS